MVSEILLTFMGQMTNEEINSSWFQQDGATAHTTHRSMQFLENNFVDRIISKDVWLPHSPDLYLRDTAKCAVYRDHPCILGELKSMIIASILSNSSEQRCSLLMLTGVTFNIVFNFHSYPLPIFYIQTCLLIKNIRA